MVFKICLLLSLSVCFLQINAIPPDILAKIPPEVVEMIYGLRAICTKKNGLTSEDIDNYQLTHTEEKYKCYMQCMMLQAKWMDKDGTIHYDKVLEETHPVIKDVLEAAFAKCRNIEESSEKCGKAFNFNLCMAKADPVHYFLP